MTGSLPLSEKRISSISTENYSFLQRQVFEGSGIVIDEGKHYLLEARLLPIVRRENLGSLDGLCARLKSSLGGILRNEVVEAMTTNETFFFRDWAPFDALRTHVLPELRARHPASRKIRLWSAAASTGQEAYSLSILLVECGFADWNVEVVASDLSEAVLTKAARGSYSELEVNRGLPPEYLQRYFSKNGSEWRVGGEIRRMVHFQKFDLRNDMARLGRFDVIFCRNVLIYFDVETKRHILRRMRAVMNPGGYLTLGAAETLLNIDDVLQKRSFDSIIYYQIPGAGICGNG